MSRSTAEQVMVRISGAEPESPIAVFLAGEAFNAVFANTIKSRDEINKGYNLIGIFHNKMNKATVKQRLDSWSNS